MKTLTQLKGNKTGASGNEGSVGRRKAVGGGDRARHQPYQPRRGVDRQVIDMTPANDSTVYQFVSSGVWSGLVWCGVVSSDRLARRCRAAPYLALLGARLRRSLFLPPACLPASAALASHWYTNSRDETGRRYDRHFVFAQWKREPKPVVAKYPVFRQTLDKNQGR